MKPSFPDTPASDPAQLRRELVALTQGLGEMAGSKDLGVVALTSSEVPVRHGLAAPPKRWLASNLTVAAMVWQTRDADERFLYLQASGDVFAAITVW